MVVKLVTNYEKCLTTAIGRVLPIKIESSNVWLQSLGLFANKVPGISCGLAMIRWDNYKGVIMKF